MRKLFTLVTICFSFSALADQCQLVDKAVAERAKLLLKNNAEIIQFCKPCGDSVQFTKVELIKNLKVRESYGYQEFILNNNEKGNFDLAYTYIKVAPNMFVNVAKVVGCPATDVPNTISK